MNDQRISLTRIIAINWYGFRQILNLSNHTLVAGAFGSGKSALLDLIQYVMLGERWRPNRAAAGSARGRSLVSYCLCDTNTSRDGRGNEPHYTRRSGVTVVGLEFTWPADGKKQPRRETWAIRLQYAGPTAEPRRTYFMIPARLEWSEIAPDGKMLDEDEFRSYLRREYGRESNGRDCIFAEHRLFRAEMATPRHLWFDQDQFEKTFPKAIAFELEDDVEKFIREFILEESPIDVKEVRSAIGAYRETQSRLEQQRDEAAHLRRICEHHKAFEVAARESAIFKHLAVAAEQARLEELLARHTAELAALREKHRNDNAEFDTKVAAKERLEVELREFRLDAGDDELRQKISEQKTRREEQRSLLEAQRSVRDRLRDLRFRWSNWLKRATDIKLEGLAEAVSLDELLIESLGAADEAEGLAAIPKLARRFNEMFQEVGRLLTPQKIAISGIDARLREIASHLERLEQGETPGSFPLFQAVKTRLANSPTPPEQLCRLVEVKPKEEEWRAALEMALGRNRFAIVVGSPEDYRAALEVLRKRGPADRGVDESLIHPREALELRGDKLIGGLADKIEIVGKDSPLRNVADRFTTHLLGRIIAAEGAEDLDLCERGITREGIYKQAPTRRRLRPLPGFEFTLGREGLKRLRAELLREQKGRMADRVVAKALVDSINQWLDSGAGGGLGDMSLPDHGGELSRLPKIEQDLAALKARIEFLSTPERADRLEHWERLQKQISKLSEEIGGLRRDRAEFAQKENKLQDSLDVSEEQLRSARMTVTQSRVGLPPGILDQEISDQLEILKKECKIWDERKARIAKLSSDKQLAAADAKNRRNNERMALVNAVDANGRPRHPEYRNEVDIEEDDNSRWDTRLSELEKVKLEESEKLVAERKTEWERRLRDQVLNRLNENLTAAERAIRQLRSYLDVRVGLYKYRISQERDPVYSTMWSLLSSGFEPTDELLAGARADDVEQALKEVMAAVEAGGSGDAPRMSLLDYRNYHRYDLRMRPADRPDGPEISLGRKGRSLSGGENQAPFFISMLAAFRRVYDLGGGRSQHLGLVVMDEAFSKLSGDGVEDCLELARNFNLQLLMAFPIDRLGVMAPFADTVIELRKEEKRDSSGFVVQLDNIPIVLTPEQVQESVA